MNMLNTSLPIHGIILVWGCEPANFHVSVYCYWIGLDSCMEVFGCFGFGLKSKQKGLGKGKHGGTAAYTCIPFLEFGRWGPVVGACPMGSFPRQHRSCAMKMCHTGSIFTWTLCSHFPRSISRKSSGMSCNAFLWWLSGWLSPEWGCWHRPFLQGLTRARHTAAADMPAAQE